MVRLATRQDIPNLIEMIREGSKEMTILGLTDSSFHDKAHIEKLLFNIIIGKGFIVLDNEFRGMLIALIFPNIWCPKVLELHQLGWWVRPKYRDGNLGARIWSVFNKKAIEMLESKRIDVVYVSYRNKEKEIDFTKHGFKPLETIFFREQ